MNLPEIGLALMPTTPVLPGAGLLRFALPVMWAVALAGSVCALGPRLPYRWRWVLTMLTAVWALIPGPLSITYWLGLAFQMPSLVTGLIAAGWLVAGLSQRRTFKASSPGLDRLGLMGIVLGWLLLLDTLALMPSSLYAWGFGTAALMLVSVLAVLFWAMVGGSALGFRGLILMAAVLVLFVVTRLPTGNLWDALLDPWLWVVLQVVWLRRLWLRWVGRHGV